MPDTDEMDLVREYANSGSETAFAEIVRQHINLVYSVALRYTGNTADAQDITQAVFIILAKKADRLGSRTVLTGWLYETTRFTARSFLRSKNRRGIREQEAYMQSMLNDSHAEAAWQQLAPLLEEAMTRLSEKDRTLVALRFFENKSGAETAAILGIEGWAAHKRTERIVEKLRKFFRKRGVVLPAAVLTAAISANSVQAAPAALAKTTTAFALTKGATASGSTLTLIKGALKLMAWSKVKTVMVVGVVSLLAVGTTTVAVIKWNQPFPRDNDPIWSDDLAVASRALSNAPSMVLLRETRFPKRQTGGLLIPNGKLAIHGDPMAELLVHAFNIGRTRMDIKTPLPEKNFDFVVTLPENQGEALQAEIRKQLHLTGRRENREVPGYFLKYSGTNGPGLKPPSSLAQDTGKGHYTGPLSSMPYSLESYLGVPVLDEIALAGDYDADVRWEDATVEKLSANPPNLPALKAALREQLGMDLVATNLTIEMLVVEKTK